jgi:hypothetical protein
MLKILEFLNFWNIENFEILANINFENFEILKIWKFEIVKILKFSKLDNIGSFNFLYFNFVTEIFLNFGNLEILKLRDFENFVTFKCNLEIMRFWKFLKWKF